MAPGRTPLMAGNWKMNLDHLQATHLVQKLDWTLKDGKHDFGAVEVAVLPPFTDIRSVQTLIDGDRLELKHGAQDLSVHDSGAYTGEVSGAFLALTLRAFKISLQCRDRFGQLLGVGISTSVFVYAVLNMFVATGLFPVTGLPLPFLSYGGSALVVNAFAVGVLLNLSRYRARDPREGRAKWNVTAPLGMHVAREGRSQ